MKDAKIIPSVQTAEIHSLHKIMMQTDHSIEKKKKVRALKAANCKLHSCKKDQDVLDLADCTLNIIPHRIHSRMRLMPYNNKSRTPDWKRGDNERDEKQYLKL